MPLDLVGVRCLLGGVSPGSRKLQGMDGWTGRVHRVRWESTEILILSLSAKLSRPRATHATSLVSVTQLPTAARFPVAAVRSPSI